MTPPGQPHLVVTWGKPAAAGGAEVSLRRPGTRRRPGRRPASVASVADRLPASGARRIVRKYRQVIAGRSFRDPDRSMDCRLAIGEPSHLQDGSRCGGPCQATLYLPYLPSSPLKLKIYNSDGPAVGNYAVYVCHRDAARSLPGRGASRVWSGSASRVWSGR